MRAVLLGLLVGCEPAVTTLTTNPPDNNTTPVDTGEPTPIGAAVSGVSASVHDEVATIIVVEWTQDVAASSSWIAYTHEGADDWMETPAAPAGAGPQSAVLLGIPSEREVTFEIFSEIDGQIVSSPEQYAAETGALPSNLYTPELRVEPADGIVDAPYMLLSVDVGPGWFYGPFYVLILDRDGEVVWYRETSDERCSMFPRVARDGDHIIIDAATLYTFEDGLKDTLTRMTLDGRHQAVTELPNLHYTWDELDDGSFVYGSTFSSRDFYLDRIYPDGSIDRIWDCYDWMDDSARDVYWACAPNTVTWQPDTDTVLWSMFETSTVVELDLFTGSVERQFGQLPGGWAIDPPSSSFDLQHYPNYTPQGTLLVSTHVPGQPGLQRAREFALDEDAKTLREIWTYGDNSSRYARYAGEIQRIGADGALMNYGTDGVLQEVSAAGEVLWEIEWRDRLIGHTTPIWDLYLLNDWDGQ